MPQLPSTRRTVALGLTLALSGLATRGVAQVTRRGPWIITKTDYPDKIRQMGMNLRVSAMASEPELEKSDVRSIRDYRNFIDTKARAEATQMGQLDVVNRYVNTHVRRVSDYSLYRENDVWAPPIQALEHGGDCEDFALVKHWGLRRLGYKPEDLFLIMGLSLLRHPPEGHAVLGVRLKDGQVYALDMLENEVIIVNDLKRFEPTYALNTIGFWQVDYAERPNGDYWRKEFELAANRRR